MQIQMMPTARTMMMMRLVIMGLGSDRRQWFVHDHLETFKFASRFCLSQTRSGSNLNVYTCRASELSTSRLWLQGPTKKVARLVSGPPMLGKKQNQMAPAADSIGGREERWAIFFVEQCSRVATTQDNAYRLLARDLFPRQTSRGPQASRCCKT